ncbi:hypothetical protein MPSEU_000065300 [Mayamaea pseudoterrestris]|nr:hypothetical protein MPSEU_000065300 [Mayamaea pseudoterrestris]
MLSQIQVFIDKYKTPKERYEQELTLSSRIKNMAIKTNTTDEQFALDEMDEPERQAWLGYKNSFGLQKFTMLSGLAAGAVTMLALNCVRRKQFNKAMLKMQQPQRRFHAGSSEPLRSTVAPKHGNARPKSFLNNPLDVSVSVLVAFVTMDFMCRHGYDSRDLIHMSKIPLLEGKSHFAALACPDVVYFYKFLHQKYPEDRDMLEHPQTIHLKAMQELVMNCQRGKRQEDLLRKSLRLDAKELVSIPPPGVTVPAYESLLWMDDDGYDDDEADAGCQGNGAFDQLLHEDGAL